MFSEVSNRERMADGIVHVLGLVGSWVGFVVLLWLAAGRERPALFVSLMVYGLGMTMMFAFSAGYHLIRRPDWKEMLRRLDHAAIFIMIAGSYTPFAVLVFEPVIGHSLLAAVWGVAVLGVVLKMGWPRRFERLSILLYLALGWSILWVLGPLIATVSTTVLVLLALGGLLYTLGVIFHVTDHRPYHTAIWHGFVLVAAACHYSAVLGAVVLS